MLVFFIWVGHEVLSCASYIGCIKTPLEGFWFLLTTGSLELVFETIGVKVFTMWRRG